jgi:Ca2+-binding RTX toxin-like protein
VAPTRTRSDRHSDDNAIGGTGDDEISTGEGFDVILGDEGTIGARPGDPVTADTAVTPGADTPQGSDYVDAGLGTDHVFGQGGNDNIVGGLTETEANKVDAADRLHGDAGNDTIDGGDGDDRIFGGYNNDNVSGGGGDDRIEGGDESTAAFADNLGDNLLGGIGADRVFGQDGDDNIVGGPGGDPELRGGDDDDVLLGDDGQVERTQGTVPEDRFDDIVTLAPPDGEGADNMEGGLGNDWLYGQGLADILKGDGGETEDGAGAGSCDDGIDNGDADGIDSADIDCVGGDDDLIGGSHDDDLFGGPGSDIMLGDGGTVDHVNTASRADDAAVLIGGAEDGPDEMHGEAGNDKMYGQDGNDLMNGGGGDDRMNGNGDVDTMNGNPGMDTMFGDPGNDIMRGNQDADEMHGSAGNDHMIGGSPTAGVADTGDIMLARPASTSWSVTTAPSWYRCRPAQPTPSAATITWRQRGNDDMYGGPGLTRCRPGGHD